MDIKFSDISVNIKGKKILSNVTVEAKEKRITAIIGPNGSGKSTLIKTFFSIVPYYQGEVLLNGQKIREIHKKEIARQVSYISQESNPQFDFTVEEVVKMGRYPHDNKGKNIDAIVYDALDVLNLTAFAKRNIRTLSGGERKLVYLARSVAQDTQSIILDEPTNHLDIKHQYMIMNYLKNCGKTVLIVLHDINLAMKFCDEIYFMKGGKVYRNGFSKQVFTVENIKAVFEVDGVVNTDPRGKFFFYVTDVE